MNVFCFAYALQFYEPTKEDWPAYAEISRRELGCDKRTVLSVFEKVQAEHSTKVATQRSPGCGQKRKLEKNNPGLMAAVFSLNSSFSLVVATEICNKTNKKIGIGPLLKNTVIDSFCAYTVMKRQAVLHCKTGKCDVTLDWALACLTRCKITLEILEDGKMVDEGSCNMTTCRENNAVPAWIDGILFSNQSHMRTIPSEGIEHEGSTSKYQ